jgi:hypothetical protein
MEQNQDLQQRLTSVPGLGTIDLQHLTSPPGRELMPIIAATLDAIDSSTLPAVAQRELTALFMDNLVQDATRRHTELLLVLRIARESRDPH